jgi:hypothetical protein
MPDGRTGDPPEANPGYPRSHRRSTRHHSRQRSPPTVTGYDADTPIKAVPRISATDLNRTQGQTPDHDKGR